MLGNIGVLLAAVLVGWMDSMWPDILIGLLIAMVVIKSALRIGIEAYSGLKNSD
jgi:Co/Zn/Cd efflux system component